ncbi:hypothetical protein A9R00_11740 [Oleispira antarctica]|uniref:Apea-like HEPN domain-containing protein n=1 Tax=Oleispira antarctica TaxID=188908 RepID=A0A1Y5HMN0_OLEAN|nr:hypothetical protein A9R00_11740 [Oleispira antarctica]
MSNLLAGQYTELKQILRAHRDDFTQVHSTRLHRSLSWLKAADEQLQAGNVDQGFINLWISFSACFYIEGEESIAPFIEKLVALDDQQRIYACLWNEYSGSVKALIKNPYVFAEFWQAQRLKGEQKESGDKVNTWRAGFDQSSVEALNCLSRKKVAPLFSIVLDRLYVLRNQVLQGGATYQSQVNREQVGDGVVLLSSIMPIIISIMLNSSEEDWGDIAYPVI